jgi:hypothetical protein
MDGGDAGLREAPDVELDLRRGFRSWSSPMTALTWTWIQLMPPCVVWDVCRTATRLDEASCTRRACAGKASLTLWCSSWSCTRAVFFSLIHHCWSPTYAAGIKSISLTEDDKLGVAASNQTCMLDLNLAVVFKRRFSREFSKRRLWN